MVLIGVIICSFLSFFLVHSGQHRRIDGWVIIAKGKLGWNGQSLPEHILPPRPTEIPGFFDWDTTSAFDPVNQENVADKSIQELCTSFPKHLLKDIQPVLKTGHGVLDARVKPQLQSVSACLDNLLIFSDVEENYMGRHLIDVIWDIPPQFRDFESQLKPWRDGSIEDGTVSPRKAWKMDKFKFLPSISRAWKERPDKKWYVFYEADTYIVWDNVFRFLNNFDPKEPHYFGSPSPGRQKTWFANGGPGFILSREAMRRLTKEDYHPESHHYLGSMLTQRHWYNVYDDCCGDSVLGWALVNVNITLSGLFPMFNPHTPHGIPFSERMWCQPVMSMHKPSLEDILGLWQWQFVHRRAKRPLLYRDLAIDYFNLSRLTPRDNWRNNAAGVGYLAPETETHPHESAESCATACSEHAECFSWTYHLRACHFVKSIRLGKQADPSAEGADVEMFSSNDLKFTAGWDNAKISKWMAARPCEEVQWLHPSWDRHI
jgi:hypothetical protein